jgi:hypothetical protein
MRAHKLLLGGAFVTALFALAGCGLVSKDVPVTATFQIGGLPTSLTSFSSQQITAPLESSAGNLSSLSSVTMTSAKLDSTDGQDFSFITGGTITIAGNNLPTVEIAKLNAPGAVGTASYTIEATPDLRAYLQGGGEISVTITYNTPPVPARGVELTLNIHATL